MKQILCFGDSNTWGLIPKTGGRFPWGIRWTSILSEKLGQDKYHVVEEGLCGRTTVFDDPLRDGRCGVKVLPTLLESHDPIDLSIIMLGTNDCKTVYGASSDVIGKGVARLVKQVRRFAPTSKVLVISPIHLGQQVWEDEFDPEFSHHSVDVSKGLAKHTARSAVRSILHFWMLRSLQSQARPIMSIFLLRVTLGLRRLYLKR